MYSSRLAAGSARAVRANRTTLNRSVRYAAQDAKTSSSGGPGAFLPSHPAASGALAGALAGTTVFYFFYYFSGVGKAVATAQQTKSYVDRASQKLKYTFKEVTPESGEAIQALHDAANKYARWLPGGQQYVDAAFNDLESVKQKHGDKVDVIVKEAYDELRDVSTKGLSLETVGETWEVLQKHLARLSELASDSAQDILKNHPELKENLGSSFGQLENLGKSLGPQAQELVDETWSELTKVVQQGVSWDSADRIRKLVEDKMKQVRKLGEQAWDKGYEHLKPTLEKNPQVKHLVDENQDLFKQGNVTEVLDKISSAVTSGSTLDLEKYIVNAKDKAQRQFSSGGLSDLLNRFPGGGKILPQLQQLKQVADAQGPEAEQLAKDTLTELSEVLERRSSQLQDIYRQAKAETK